MSLLGFELDPEEEGSSSRPVRFELAPDVLAVPEGVSTIVREALIPFVVWRNVPVRVLVPRRLGHMEAFLLEAALILDRFAFLELQTATSVPQKVVAEAAEKLIRRGVLVEVAKGICQVDKSQVDLLLSTKSVEEEHLSTMTLAYFPRQDIVTADEEIAEELSRIAKKLKPPRRAPFPSHIELPKSVKDFLTGRIEAGQIAGAPNRVLGLGDWPKPPAWPELCPCFYGRGYVRNTGFNAIAQIDIWGRSRLKSRSHEYESGKVRLVGEQLLVDEWLNLTSRFANSFHGAVEKLPRFSPAFGHPLGPTEWIIGVMHDDAALLAEGRWLTDVLPISICSSTAKVEIRVTLEPADRRGAELFALDAVAQAFDMRKQPYSETEFAALVRNACQRYSVTGTGNISRARVEDRLWAQNRFMAVYAQRSITDFSYD